MLKKVCSYLFLFSALLNVSQSVKDTKNLEDNFGQTTTCHLQLECRTKPVSESSNVTHLENRIRIPINSARGPPGREGRPGPQGPPCIKDERYVPKEYRAAIQLTLMKNRTSGDKEQIHRFIFDTVDYRNEFIYNEDNGEIKVPFHGLYFLAATVTAQSYYEASLRVVVDDVLILDSYSSSKPWAPMNTQGIFILKKDSKIWFENVKSQHHYGEGYCSFTAFLLYHID